MCSHGSFQKCFAIFEVILKNMKYFKKVLNKNTEKFLLASAQYSNFTIARFSSRMFLIAQSPRERNIFTAGMSQTVDEVFGVHVKYHSEYYESLKTCFQDTEKIEWQTWKLDTTPISSIGRVDLIYKSLHFFMARVMAPRSLRFCNFSCFWLWIWSRRCPMQLAKTFAVRMILGIADSHTPTSKIAIIFTFVQGFSCIL